MQRVSTWYNHSKFGKVSSINEGIIPFLKKVYEFLDTLNVLVYIFKVGLKPFLQQGLSELGFYGLVYNLQRKIVSKVIYLSV